MIALDTSALIAILADEPERGRCERALYQGEPLVISAGTYAELTVVALRMNVLEQAIRLVEDLNVTVIDVTPDVALRVGEIYRRWGKGFHPAGLNFGDCFAYEAAKSRNCPLLYVGQDFSRTDVLSALPTD